MLSENLKALSLRLSDFRHTGLEISPEVIASICAVLDQAKEDALELERSSLPPRCRSLGRGLLVIDGGRS